MKTNPREEMKRMARVPWIIFTDEPGGRRAEVGGSGLAVWEIIAVYRALGEDWDELRARFDWLSEEQLQAALEYYRLYPDEIDARVQEEEAFRIEDIWQRYPFTKPDFVTR